MNTNKRIKILIGIVLVVFCMLSSCIAVIDSKQAQLVSFKNCTSDTLFVGVSHNNNIDSMKYVVWSESFFPGSESDILLENGDFHFESDCVVYPDSICEIDDACLFSRSDTCYFFLIKWSDAKRYSWDVIRDKKMYRTWIVTRDKDGNYDKNIRYSDDCLEKTR